MELTANRRPFLYFPLRHHFEQNFHVRHRLERYRAGRCMDFEQSTPETIAAAIAESAVSSARHRCASSSVRSVTSLSTEPFGCLDSAPRRSWRFPSTGRGG
jgi:UDP-N-acetylglucosamine:LPS N-acetylglucosamine transferase